MPLCPFKLQNAPSLDTKTPLSVETRSSSSMPTKQRHGVLQPLKPSFVLLVPKTAKPSLRLLRSPPPLASRGPATDDGALRLRLRSRLQCTTKSRRRETSWFQAEAIRGLHGGGAGAVAGAPPAAVPVLVAAVALSEPIPPLLAGSSCLPRSTKARLF